MKTLCKDQREDLVAKLTVFLKGLTGEEIDNIVKEVKEQTDAETKKDRKNELIELFDSQMETIRSILDFMKIPSEPILNRFLKKKDDVISAMIEIWKTYHPEETIESLAGKGIYLGIPVIPPSCLGYNGLMAMVRNGDKIGYTALNPNKIRDLVETPKEPYYILDVGDGRKYLGKSPENAEKLIKEQNRSCLTADEGIALCVHSDVLGHHNIDLTGSRDEDSDGVPGVCLSGDVPGLRWAGLDCSHDRWGSASCRSRA
jgi:hypothetical protein